jgi:hypothetical protein
MGEVVALGRMREAEYDEARAKLGNRKDAKAKWDQEQAKLFVRSGWTSDALARKEQIHVRTMQLRLLFGRFVDFAEKRTNVRSLELIRLTEYRFRTFYWPKTGRGNEPQRFLSVLQALQATVANRSIPAAELYSKLRPILDVLKEYGSRHVARAYPPAMAEQARKLQALLDEWTK